MLNFAESCLDQLIKLRRHFHQYPELSNEEFETTRYIRRFLEDNNIEILDLNLKTGLIAVIKGNHKGKKVALRADIDALPIAENFESSYKSVNEGVMHACGHDFHMASLMGAAVILNQIKDQIKGEVYFIFQPAEETDDGAKQICQVSVINEMDAIFGIHNAPEIPVGYIGIKSGPLMASIDHFKIKIKGVGGHGANPHLTIDPIVCAANVIQALQVISSREIDPVDTAVISCCMLNAGTAYNIIPEIVSIEGTVRSFTVKSQRYIENRLKDIVYLQAKSFKASVDIEYSKEVPAVNNSELETQVCINSAEKIFGKEKVITPNLCMGGDDFAIYLEKIPGAYMFLGVGNSSIGADKPWHHSCYTLDENALPYGAAILSQVALDYLRASI